TLVLWPIVLAAPASNMPRSVRPDVAAAVGVSPRVIEPVVVIYTIVGAVSVWWMILSAVFLRFPRLPVVLFPPFGARFKRSDALVVLLIAATVFVLWLSKADAAWRALNVLW